MSVTQAIQSLRDYSDDLTVRIDNDPAGRFETPATPSPRIAVHLGRTVYMIAERAGMKHRGWAVHGDIEVVPANTSCVWEPNGTDTAVIVTLSPRLIDQTATDLGRQSKRIEILNRFQIRDAQIEHIVWAIHAEMDAGYPNGRIFIDSLASALAVALVQRHSSDGGPSPASHAGISGLRLRQAVSYIEDNLGRNLSLLDIAQAVGLSVSHLKTTFREATGMPVHQFVIERRVKRAAALLKEGTLTIRETAKEAGFAHQSHLAKHMKRILDCSPKEIRRRSQ